MSNPSVKPWVVRHANATPTATRAAQATMVHFIACVIAVVDTAARTLSVKSGTTDLFTAALGIGTHIISCPATADCPGLPALAKNALVSAGLTAGTAQIVTMYGSSRPCEIETS